MAVWRCLGSALRCITVSALLLSAAVSNAGNTAEDERLLGVARLWRDVKLYHPEVVRGKVDWDDALVTSLPAMASAST
ncbi:MAG: hypothetical protein JWR56_1120, partial [Massilia sp.]|nr:hypothetical protein [Massilia sp.]